MVRVLELTSRWRAASFALIVVAGCTSSGSNEVIASIWEGIGNAEPSSEPNMAEEITRAQIDKLGVALLRVEESQANLKKREMKLLVAFRKTGEQVSYVLRNERRLILHGGLIQATYGFGDNLNPIGIAKDDPIAFPRPLSRWPEQITRQYTLSEHGPGTPATVVCTYQSGVVGDVEIVGKVQRLQTVTETCRGGGLAFSNTYDINAVTGIIWRSVQWTGQAQGLLAYEVLEPLEG